MRERQLERRRRRVQVRGAVGLLTLNRPKALNALSPDLVASLVEEARALDADPAVGAIVLIVVLTALVVRGLMIGAEAFRADFLFGAYCAWGMSLLIGVQAAINIGVNVGVLPTKGLTLPLISFGGNSLIASFLMLGVVIRVGWETRRGHGA